jgi:hypothetical protein
MLRIHAQNTSSFLGSGMMKREVLPLEEDLEALQSAGIQAVVRLNIGVNPTIIFEKGQEGRKIYFWRR